MKDRNDATVRWSKGAKRRATLMGLAIVIACAGCRSGTITATAGSPSVIVVSLDTLRADHLGSYGYSRPTSPVLDRFAGESVRFSDASAQASGTLPSHLSLLTSLEPTQFRISRDDGRNGDQMRTKLRLSDAVLTLAEVFRTRGYATAAFTEGGFVSARYGMDRGFEVFDEATDSQRDLRATIAKIAAFLHARGNGVGGAVPLFLFVHTYDVHAPYSAPEPYDRWFSSESYDETRQRLGFAPDPEALSSHRTSLTPFDVDQVRALYDNGIRAADAAMEQLFDLLRASGLYEDSVLVVLSDHGEEFLEHGDFNHGRTVYQELVHVPLLLRLPQAAEGGRVVETPVSLLDVAPTVLAACAIPVPEQFEGSSLLPLVRDAAAEGIADRRSHYFESPNVARGACGLREGSWKFIRDSRAAPGELYNLETDPGERDDLAASRNDLRDALALRLDRRVRDAETHGKNRGWFAVPADPGNESPASLERLRALGYLQ